VPGNPTGRQFNLQAVYDVIHKKPETNFSNVKADVLADKDPKFKYS
jgi:hypothetical protein